MPKKIYKIGMFGPGLETNNTRPIVRKILEDKTGVFTVTGMFPGMERGEETTLLNYSNVLYMYSLP